MTMPDNTVITLFAELAKRVPGAHTPVALRHMLLPKVISGELLTKDPEHIVWSHL